MTTHLKLRGHQESAKPFKHIQAAGCLFSVPWEDLKDIYKTRYSKSDSFVRFDGLDVVKVPYEAINNHKEAIFESFDAKVCKEVLAQLFPVDYKYYLLYAPVFDNDGDVYIDIEPATRLIPFDIDLNLDFNQYIDGERILEFDLSVEGVPRGSFYYIGLTEDDYSLLEFASYADWTQWAITQLMF